METPKHLLHVCEMIIDCEHKTAPTQSTGYPSIRTPNIGKGRLILEEVFRVSEEVYQEWTKRAVPQENDIILAREAPVGNVALIPSNLKVCLGQRTVLIRANKAFIEPHYLLYLLLGDDMQGRIQAPTTGATVKHINVADIKELILPILPPLPIQRKIAAILSAYDDIIENNTRRIALLEQMAQAIYREWFVEYRYPGHEDVPLVESALGMVPQGWEVVKLEEKIELAYGKGLPTEYRKEGPIPVYGSSGIVGNHNLALVQGPGIILGRKGNVGSVFWSSEDFYPIDTVYFIRSNLSLYYLYYNLQHQRFINNDAAVPGLSRNQAYSLPLLVPDIKHLEKFQELMYPIFTQKVGLLKRNTTLRHTRDLLLPKLISGEVDVSEITIAGAEELVL